MWRRVTSIRLRPRRIALYIAISLVIVTLALRAVAGIFEYRVLKIVNGLAQVRLDQTTKAEFLKNVPGMEPGEFSSTKCSTEECYSKEIYAWPPNRVYSFLAPSLLQTQGLRELAFWLGLRFARFSAYVEFKDGKVHYLYYTLMVVNTGRLIPEMPFLNVSGVQGYPLRFQPEIDDENPDYRMIERRASVDGMSAIGLNITFTRGIPAQLVRHAFDLQLNCIWQLRGCTSTGQLLPRAWQYKTAIESARIARLQSADPCPDRLLPRHVHDSSDVLLAEVARLLPNMNDEFLGECRIADYRLLQVLKGSAGRPLEHVVHPVTLSFRFSETRLPNPAIRLLYPGSRVLIFSDYPSAIASPCEVVAAIPSAMQSVQAALASPSSQVADEDCSLP
jgi:hypothetical protein